MAAFSELCKVNPLGRPRERDRTQRAHIKLLDLTRYSYVKELCVPALGSLAAKLRGNRIIVVGSPNPVKRFIALPTTFLRRPSGPISPPSG